jgi:hypothetical protein
MRFFGALFSKIFKWFRNLVFAAPVDSRVSRPVDSRIVKPSDCRTAGALVDSRTAGAVIDSRR